MAFTSVAHMMAFVIGLSIDLPLGCVGSLVRGSVSLFSADTSVGMPSAG
jgi:hypothetical protein